jgi:hypothetical protein
MSVPDKIILSITNLALDGHIYAKDVPLPEGVSLVTAGETLVVQCVAAKLVDDALPGAVAEPEVIRKAKDDKEEAAKS